MGTYHLNALLKTLTINSILGISLLVYASETKITFGEALSIMQSKSPDLKIKKSQLIKAEAEHLDSVSHFIPTLSFKAADQQYSQGVSQRSQSLLLSTSLNIFSSGADYATYQSTLSAIQEAKFSYESALLKYEQLHTRALIDFIKSSMKLEVIENNVRLNHELGKIEKQRYSQGLIPLQDSQKADIETDNSLARFQDSKEKMMEIVSILESQLGHVNVLIDWPWKKLLMSETKEKWLNSSLQLSQSPVWNESNANYETEKMKTRSLFLKYFPTLDLNFSYGYQNYLSQNLPGWGTYLLFTLPLFDLSQNSDYKTQIQNLAISDFNREKTKIDLESQWKTITNQIKTALISAKQRDKTVILARRLYEDNLRRLRLGRSSFNDVVVDQNRLTDAELLAIDGWANVHQLYAEYCHILGYYTTRDTEVCTQND